MEILLSLGMVNPGHFWVREIRMNQKSISFPGKIEDDVWQIEQKLAQEYNVEPKANPENEVKEVRRKALVAIRTSYR